MSTDTIKWIEINLKVLDTINDNRSIIGSTEVESCFSKIKKTNSPFLGNQSRIAGVHNFVFIIVIFWFELQLVDLCSTREIYKIERYRVKEC